jgi:hypothetical protein
MLELFVTPNIATGYINSPSSDMTIRGASRNAMIMIPYFRRRLPYTRGQQFPFRPNLVPLLLHWLLHKLFLLLCADNPNGWLKH